MRERDYQKAAVDSIFTYFTAGGKGNPIVAMPTGTGKSIVIASFLKRVYDAYPNQRVVVLTHVKELISQNAQKLLDAWPTAPVGVYSAGLKRKELHAPITFAGIQSIVRANIEQHVDLVIIDECHLVNAQSSTMYARYLERLREVNPLVKAIGFSATPWRNKLGSLTRGGIFTDVCFDAVSKEAFLYFIDNGWLTGLIPTHTNVEIDTSAVHISGGEFVLSELQAATDNDVLTTQILEEAVRTAKDRNHWLVFAAGVEHSNHVAEKLNDMGFPSAAVHSKISDDERDEYLAAFRGGELRCLVNNNVLTTGVDLPMIDCILMLRATRSPGLWVQMLGRGTRVVYAPGHDLETPEGRVAAIKAGPKPDCLVLDYARNTSRLGPINDPVMPKPRTRKGTAPVKACDACQAYVPTGTRLCPYCSWEFPAPRVNKELEKRASDEALISRGALPDVRDLTVTDVHYSRHTKPGKPDSVKVTYHCGLNRYHDWLCFDHDGYPKHHAHEWWRKHCDEDVPATTDEALERVHEVGVIDNIAVWVNRKPYAEVLE